MKQLLLLIATCLVSGCTFLNNTSAYRDTSVDFIESLLKEDYDRCINLMSFDRQDSQSNKDTVKIQLAPFRTMLIENFGDRLDYTLMKTEKKWSTGSDEQLTPNTFILLLQFDNSKQFGVMQFLFDDQSGKIANVTPLEVKEPIPNMLPFWLFGILPLVVLLLNVYALIKVKRSNLARKWDKYLMIVLLNVPTIGYNALTGFFFKLISLQIMGVGFSMMGYANSAWKISIPLGSIYVLWKLYEGLFPMKGDELPIGVTDLESPSTESAPIANS